MVKFLRIKQERIRKYAELIGGLSIPLAILLFAYLQNIGAITILDYNWSPICAGTEEDFCWATITFKANTDIYVYPSENNSWLFSTDKKLKLLRIERKWGDGWREIKLNESCNGRWCGCYWCDKNHKAKYSYVFRKGRTYVVRFVGYKYNPYSDVKWSFSDKIDPLWKGVNKGTLLSDTKKFYADILDDIGEHKVIINKTIPKVRMKKWEDETYIDIKINDTKYIPLGLVKDSKSPVIGKRLSEFSAKYKKTEKEIKIYSLNISREGRNVNGIEYEITLNEKPVSNKIKFEIDTKNLKFYYQPPLNEEKHEKDLTCNETDCWDENGTIHTHRPIDVVGSYAVYHESKSGDYSKMGGKNYMAGKAFHIYRPKIIDSKGNWIWGNLSIDEKKGILTIEIDQNFLDKAVYPVKIDPTFGYDTVGGSSYTVWDFDGINTSAPEDGTIVSITTYLGNQSGNISFGIYNDNSGALGTHIAHGTAISNPSTTDWKTINVSGSVTDGNIYWLIVQSSSDADDMTDYYDSVSGYKMADDLDWCNTEGFDTWSDNPPIDYYYDGYAISIYCTYTAGGGGTTFSITLNSPPNQTTTSDSTPDFNFTVSGTESSYSCELFINDIGYGTETASNNTATIITANQSLSDGTYDWYVNCSSGGVTNQSEVREITISLGWWNSSWSYRQPINISNTAGDLTNYQVRIDLNSSNVGSNFNWSNNGSDIRFTNSTEDLLNFWIESWNSTGQEATIWVNVTYLANNTNTTIYMYYGNSEASSESDGDLTFEFFDDFNSNSDLSLKGIVEASAIENTPMEGQMFSQAIHYSKNHNRTYIVYLSDAWEHRILYYDHDTKTWSSSVKVADCVENDLHENPVIAIDNEGYIYVFYNAHGNMRMKKSTNPENITSWGSAIDPTDGYGTYPKAFVDSSNTIYLLHMHTGGVSDDKLAFTKSEDNGSTWASETTIVDVTSNIKRCYSFKAIIDSNDVIHVGWTQEDLDGTRRHVFYMKSEDGGSTWKKADGTLLSTPVSETTGDKAYNSNGWCQGFDLVVDSNNYPIMAFSDDKVYGIVRWNGSAWESHSLGVTTGDHFNNIRLQIINDTTYRAWLFANNSTAGRGGELQIWESNDNGVTWTKIEDVTKNSPLLHRNVEIPEDYTEEVEAIWNYGTWNDEGNGANCDILYYGTASPVFEKEIGSGLNTSKWNEENTGGTLTIENSQLKISMSASTTGKIRSIYSADTFSSGYIFETKASVDSVNLPYNSIGFGMRYTGFSTTTPTGGLCFGDYTNSNNYLATYYGESGSYGTIEYLSQYDGFHRYSIEYDSTDNVIYKVDGSAVYTKSNTDSFQTTNHITFASFSHSSVSYSENDELLVDWVIVRKYADPEPTISSFGSEESGGEETSFSITLNSPPNQTTTSDSTPDFNFTVSGTESSYSCELFINDIGYGTATANNNTATIITANQSLSDGTYDWYVNCSSGGVTNQSEVREITIDTNPPTFSNWQQNPPDLNSSSVGKLYINVTITDDSGVNNSSVKFYHWINDSQYPNQPWCFINGTAWDFECEHNMTNITSSIFNITLHTYAYNPSTHNVHPETMSSATKYNHSLSSNNKALKVRFYNISTHPNTTYILKSKLYRNSGDLLVYYCNSSYTSGKVYNSDYCIPITTLTSQEGTTYQNIHFYGDENSNIDGVKITSTGYIVFYALTGSDWEVEYANIDSNSAETTNNGGTGWTNQDFTPDVWIIQLNGNGLTTFGYKVYACDTLGNCGNSSIQEDSYAIANLPPSPAPEIIVPENSTYSGTFNITWIASKDPNGDPFNYSLYLYYSNGTLADVLADNNITEGTEYFTFDSTQYPDGQYYLISNATDDAGNTNYYIMPYYFTLSGQPDINYGLNSGITFRFPCNLNTGTTYGQPEGQNSTLASIWCKNNGTGTGNFQARLNQSLPSGWWLFIANSSSSTKIELSTSWQTFYWNVASGTNVSNCAWFWNNCSAGAGSPHPNVEIEFRAVS